MNNSKTPKIVVGVGLVAIYATGMAVFALRAPHDSVIAQSPPTAASAQMAAAPAATPPATSAPAEMPAPVAPAVTDVAKAPTATRPSVASQPKPRAEEVPLPVASLPSPRPAAGSDAEESSRSNSGSNVVSELPAADTVASESVTSAEDTTSGEDSENAGAPALDTGNQ